MNIINILNENKIQLSFLLGVNSSLIKDSDLKFIQNVMLASFDNNAENLSLYVKKMSPESFLDFSVKSALIGFERDARFNRLRYEIEGELSSQFKNSVKARYLSKLSRETNSIVDALKACCEIVKEIDSSGVIMEEDALVYMNRLFSSIKVLTYRVKGQLIYLDNHNNESDVIAFAWKTYNSLWTSIIGYAVKFSRNHMPGSDNAIRHFLSHFIWWDSVINTYESTCIHHSADNIELGLMLDVDVLASISKQSDELIAMMNN